jgi:hypothetical protein
MRQEGRGTIRWKQGTVAEQLYRSKLNLMVYAPVEHTNGFYRVR